MPLIVQLTDWRLYRSEKVLLSAHKAHYTCAVTAALCITHSLHSPHYRNPDGTHDDCLRLPFRLRLSFLYSSRSFSPRTIA